MPELTWGTQSDWDAAQSRQRVITRDIGVRSGDDLALGWDTDHGPVSDAVSYWSMDETSGDMIDIIGGNDANVNGASLGATGPLGTNAVSFDGVDDYLNAPVSADPTGGGSFSIAVWVDKRAHLDTIDTMVRNGDSTNGTYFFDFREGYGMGLGFYNDSGGLSWDNTFHAGADWMGRHFVVGTYDESADELVAYLDGSPDSLSISGSRPAHSDDINIGRSGAGNRYFNGNIGPVILWDRALSQSEVDELTETLQSGSLETSPQQFNGQATDISIDADIASVDGVGGSVTVPQHTRESSTSVPQGVNIIPQRQLDGLRLTLPEGNDGYAASGYTRAYVAVAIDPQNPLASVDVSGYSAGDTFDIDVTLDADTDYNIYLGAEGASYYRSAYEDSSQFPYTTDDFEITTGVYTDGNSRSSNNFYNWQSVEAIVGDGGSTSVSATVHQSTDDGDETEDIIVEDGTNTYSLSNFSESDSEYWISYDLSTPSHTTSPVIHNTVLTVQEPSLQPVGTVPVAADGTVYDVPIYDESELVNQGFPIGPGACDNNGNIGMYKLLDEGETKWICCTDGTLYSIALTE